MYRLRKARSGLNKSSPASLPSPAGRIASVGANDVTMLLMRDSEFVVAATKRRKSSQLVHASELTY
jgi:hypothetical protein